MRRGLLLLIAILILVQMTSATPDDGAFGQFPDAGSGSYYPDPEGLLPTDLLPNAFCSICNMLIRNCNCYHSQPHETDWLETPTFSSFLSDPEWNPDTTHTYPHSAPAGPEPERPRFTHFVDPPREDGNQSHPVQVWLRPTYTAGDRQESANPSLLGSPIPSMLGSPASSKLGSPTPSLTESQAPSNGSGRKRATPRTNGFPCHRCPKAFNRQTDLNRHMRKHLLNTDKPQKCSQCGKGFIYPKDLRRHYSTHRSSDSRLFCSYEECKNHNGFTRKDNYDRHMRSKHSVSSINTAPSVSGTSTS